MPIKEQTTAKKRKKNKGIPEKDVHNPRQNEEGASKAAPPKSGQKYLTKQETGIESDGNKVSKHDKHKCGKKKKKPPQPFKYTRMLLRPVFLFGYGVHVVSIFTSLFQYCLVRGIDRLTAFFFFLLTGVSKNRPEKTINEAQFVPWVFRCVAFR